MVIAIGGFKGWLFFFSPVFQFKKVECPLWPLPNSPRLQNAIDEAMNTIRNNQALTTEIKQAALRNLQQGNVITRTVGAGNAKNSTLK
jgi:hypothetical protein